MFGPHVNRVHAEKKASMLNHIKAAQAQAKKDGVMVTVVSVFVSNPRQRKITMPDGEAAELKQYVEQGGVRIIAHGSYTDFPWGGDPSAVEFVRKELAACESIGAEGMVVHLAAQPVERVVKILPRLLTSGDGTQPSDRAESKIRLYLETPAISPSKSLYETPDKLQKLFSAIKESKNRVGLCVDTAHLWSCGVDISSFKLAEKWFNELAALRDLIPPDRVMIHLNDSMYGCGDGRDAHAPLLDGKIWEKYKDNPARSGLAAILRYALKNKTPVILERKPPKALTGDYYIIHSLCDL